MLIENLDETGKNLEKEVSIICVPTLLFPHFFPVLMLLLITMGL